MDTPHKGTPALEQYFAAKEIDPVKVGLKPIFYVVSTGVTLALFKGNQAKLDKRGSWLFAASVFGAIFHEVIGNRFADFFGSEGDLDLNRSDGITDYVRPRSANIAALNSRVSAGNGFALPTMRVYRGHNGISFVNPDAV